MQGRDNLSELARGRSGNRELGNLRSIWGRCHSGGAIKEKLEWSRDKGQLTLHLAI